MKLRLVAPLLGVLALARPGGTAEAIIIRHDRDDARYLALGARYPAVCRVEVRRGERRLGGEGTLVRPEWVLTAAHVGETPVPPGGTRSVACGGVDYPVAEVVLHPEWARGGWGRHDIALVRLERPVRGIAPVPEYAGRDEAGMPVVFVGRGMTGTGRTGPRREAGGPRLRGATNRIERVDRDLAYFVFDPPGSPAATDLEGISGPGDSGGPALVVVRGRTYVAAVSAWGNDSGGDGITGTYGDLEVYTRVSSYAAWIREVAAGR